MSKWCWIFNLTGQTHTKKESSFIARQKNAIGDRTICMAHGKTVNVTISQDGNESCQGNVSICTTIAVELRRIDQLVLTIQQSQLSP